MDVDKTLEYFLQPDALHLDGYPTVKVRAEATRRARPDSDRDVVRAAYHLGIARSVERPHRGEHLAPARDERRGRGLADRVRLVAEPFDVDVLTRGGRGQNDHYDESAHRVIIERKGAGSEDPAPSVKSVDRADYFSVIAACSCSGLARLLDLMPTSEIE